MFGHKVVFCCGSGAGAGAALCLSAAILSPYLHITPTDLFGDVCDARALGEQLIRMGEALGFTTVPLTPGGSVAVEAEEAAAAAAAGQQGWRQQQRRHSSRSMHLTLCAHSSTIGVSNRARGAVIAAH